MACRTCRLRKVKCTGERPRCKNCAARALDCAYEGERIKRRKLNTEERSTSTENRSSFQQSSTSDSGRLSSSSGMNEYAGNPNDEPYLSPPSTNSCCITVENSQPRRQDRIYHRPQDHLDRIFSSNPQPMPANCNPSVWIRSEVGDEYTGPSSGISVISDKGLSLLESRFKKCDCLGNIFKQLRSTLLNHLRQPKCMGPDLWSNFPVHSTERDLPPWNTIHEYVDDYFNEIQVHFPVLSRERFETQLMDFKSGHAQDHRSWKALLYAVLASGCRATLSDETAAGFQKSANEAWGYFVSALSYEPMLVHVATDLMAVQALAVMTVFAQGMSSPQRVEFTLCSTAVRLAYSLAMNCAPPAEWNLSEIEKEERNRTFWTIYCLDKTLALRCGRPSAIDDAEISCDFPRRNMDPSARLHSAGEDARQPFDFFLCMTKYARICGQISRGLYSAFALSRYCTELSEQAIRLLNELRTWRSDVPATKSFRQSNASVKDARQLESQLLFLQLSYYYALCAIYRRFGPIFCQVDEDENETQALLTGVTDVSQIEAARSMVLLTKHIDVESYSPGWLVFYQPMTALLTIFLHLISSPTDKSAANDVALMEVAVGFFGRLEYVTSGEAGFTQVTEFVRHARSVVNKSARSLCSCVPNDSGPPEPSDQSCVQLSNKRAEDVFEFQNHLQEATSLGNSGETRETLHPGDYNADMSTGAASFELCTATPFDAMRKDPVDKAIDFEISDLGAHGYEPWLDLWSSPLQLELSGTSGLA